MTGSLFAASLRNPASLPHNHATEPQHRIEIYRKQARANEKSATNIEVKEDRLMLTRHGDFIALGGKFPRWSRKDAKARLKEIKKLLLVI